jgi:hypothetical protein
MVEALVDSYDEIILNGIPMKTAGRVPDVNLSVFGGKVVTGDYTKDSNPLLSAWVISDLSGGHGVEDMNEGVDVARYLIGDMYTRYPNQISKAFKANQIANDASWGTGKKWFFGDLYVSAVWQAIVGVGNGAGATLIRRLSSPASAIGTMTAHPIGNAVVFQGIAADSWMMIPFGTGFSRVSNNAYAFANQASGANHPAAHAFVVWDNKLIAIDSVGQLWYTLDPTGNWTSYGATAKLPQGDVPKSLVRYFDRQGQPAVFVVTDRSVWQFDPNTPEIFSVDVEFPTHPHHGLASARWGGDLYFSVGMGVHRYTGGSLSAVGLDRDHGLPETWSTSAAEGSKIVAFAPGYNSLFALVQSPLVNSITIDGQAVGVYSSLHEYTGTGWHLIWQGLNSTTSTAIENSMAISQHEGNYRLYWAAGSSGVATTLYYINLPRSFANPRQRARQTGGFSTSGDLWTGIFDAGMRGYNKLANAVDVTVSHMPAGATLTVYYKTSGFSLTGTAWNTLGTVTATGTTSLPFGTLAAGIYPGLVFERIQFQFGLAGGSSENAFLMESAVLSFIALKPSSYSWTVGINLDESHGGLSPQDIIDALDDIIEAGVMVPFVLRGTTYRVFVSQVQGALDTGASEGGTRTVSLLQIPQTLGAG